MKLWPGAGNEAWSFMQQTRTIPKRLRTWENLGSLKLTVLLTTATLAACPIGASSTNSSLRTSLFRNTFLTIWRKALLTRKNTGGSNTNSHRHLFDKSSIIGVG